MKGIKFVLAILLILFVNIISDLKAQQHNADAGWLGEWVLAYDFYFGSEEQINYCTTSDLKDDFKFCVIATHAINGKIMSFGSMDPSGNDTDFDCNGSLNETSPYWSALYFYESGETTGCGGIYLEIFSYDFPEWTDGMYSLTIRIKKVSTNEIYEEELPYDGDWYSVPDSYHAQFNPESSVDPPAPILTATPIIAGCWSEGGTIDLTEAVSVSPADATVTVNYYSDKECTKPILNGIASMGDNPSASVEDRQYWANIDGDDVAKAKQIDVKLYQKPDVNLAVTGGTTEGGKTKVCKGNPITLQTLGNSSNFGSKAYDYWGKVDEVNTVLQTQTGSSYTTAANGSVVYTVYVTSVNGCKDTASAEVEVTPVIAGSDIQIAITEGKDKICSGEELHLTASLKAGSSYTGTPDFTWSNNVSEDKPAGASITVKPAQQTTYTVHASLNGCTSETSVGSQVIMVRELPTFTIPASFSDCEVVSISQSGIGYGYFSDKNCQNPLPDPAQIIASGKYYVTFTNTQSGITCTSTAKEVQVSVNPNPTPKILVNGAAPNGDELCAGTEIKLSCDNNTYKTYTWTGGTAATNSYERNAKIVAGASNSFGLTVKDENGCEGTATAVAITGKAAPTVSIENIGEACKGDEVTLKANITWVTGKQTILWKGNNITDATLETTTATLNGQGNKYDLTITDQNSCQANASTTVQGNEIKAADLSINPTSVKAGEDVNLDITAKWNNNVAVPADNISYTWKKTVSASESTIANTKAATDAPNANSTYKIVVEKNGCKDSVSGAVTVETDPFELAGIDGYRAVCDKEDLSTNPVKLYVTASGGQKDYTYKWTYPAGMTVDLTNPDTLKITSIDYTQMLAGGSHAVSVAVEDATGTKDSKTIPFEVRELPTITINGENGGAILQACKDGVMNLQASVSNGTVKGYSWSTGGTSAAISAPTDAVGTTSYIVTATTSIGCTNKDSVKVQVNELPEINLTAQLDGANVLQVCTGTEITLNATVTDAANPDLSWSKGASGLTGSTPKTEVKAKTSYEVAYRDASTTCEAKTEVTVDVFPVVDLAVSVDPGSNVCAGSKVTLTASNGASYQWAENGSDIPSATTDKLEVEPNSSVTYTVKGKDGNGCEATPAPPVDITIIPAPKLVLSQTTLDGCVGGPDVDLAAAVAKTSTPGITLKVRNSKGDILTGTTVNTSGVYTLFLDNGSNSCSSNAEKVEVIIHDKPNVSFHPSIAEVCSGDEVTLTASSTDTKQPTFTYGGTDNTTWKVKPENTGNENTPKTYTVTAKDSYGCTNTADAVVTVKPLPKVKITDPGAVCEASKVTLSAEGATTYAWSGAAQSGNAPTYEVQPTSKVNKFYVIGTDENGCKGKDSITLTVNEVPVLAEAKPFRECDKTEINLEKAFVEGGYTLSFYDENQDPISGSNIIVDGDKTYYAKASNENCTSEFAPIPVTAKPLPKVAIEEIGEICAGGEVELKASGENIVSYLWSPAGKGNVTSGATITANPSVTTEYIVKATGNNNCTNTDTVKVKVNPLPELKWDAGNPSDLVAGEKKTWNVIFKKETTPGYAYTWLQNGIINPNFPNNNYSLEGGAVNPEKLAVCVTDGKGCTSDTLKTSVTVTPQGGELMITLTAESEEICQGGMQILTATPSGGESPYKYVWYKVGEEAIIAQGVSSLTVTEAGTYKVSVTDDGVTQQTKEASIEVKISTSLTAPTVTVADLTIPKGNSTILLPTVTPANGSYTYQWSEVANLKDADQATLVNPETQILESDTPYDLVVKDGNGCYSKKATGTVHVNDENGFKVVASVDLNKVCLNNPAQLTATLHGNVSENVTYEWIPATWLSATDIANPVFSSATPDVFDFIVKVTDNTSGSVAVAKVTVEAENKTAPTLALAPASGNSCVGEAITVTADGVSEYQWIIDGRDPIVGGNSLDTLVAGNRKVKVTATATNGCVITPVEGNYQIHDLPTIAFDPNTPNKVDKGSVLTVTAIADDGASGNYTYTWSSPQDGTAVQNTYTITMDDAQTFAVSVKDNVTGCVSGEISTDVTVQKPTSPVEITVNSESVLLCLNGISLLEVTGVKGGNGTENEFSDYRYEWTKSGDANVLSTEKSYTATADGTYTVKVTEPNTGKSTTKDITVTNSSLSAPLVADATLTIQKGEQAFLFATVTGGTPDYAYCWTPLSSLSTANTIPNPTTSALSASETFTCYVTDANKCSGKGEIQVDVVDPSEQLFTLVAKADNTNPCMGNTVNLTATPSRELTNATYEWTPATGLSAADIANPIFTPATLGTTIFTVKVTEQGAYSRTAQVAVTVQSNEAPHLALTDNTGGCAGEVLTATNTNGNVTVTKYHWVIDGTPDNEKTGETYPLGAGAGQTVKVYATAANGCASDTASGVFSRKPTPEIEWDQQPASAKEEEDFKLSVKADADVKYVWSYVFTPEGGVAQPAKSGANRDYFEKVGAEKGTYAFTVYVEKDGCPSEKLTNTVIVLDKDAGLTVTTDPKGEQQICANGSIIVTATAFNGSGNYTFNWYAGTTVSGNPVAKGKTVVLSPTVNGQKYVVEVNDGNTTAVSLPITLTFNNNTAPTIAGGTQNVAAGQSTILLSKVTQGTAASYHWSSPNDLLVSGDETKANPATKPLSDDETYTYYVKDANGCISKPADVKVVVDKAADALAIEATADMVNLCLGNVSHFKVSATKGTLSADAEYEWTPSTNLTGENTAEPVFTTTTGGNYPYLVTVRDQGKVLVASVSVTVKENSLPEFAWDEPNCTASYNKVGDPITVTTKVTKETKKPYKYHWLKPFEETNELHDYEVQTTTQSQYDFAVVMIDANGCQTRDTLKKHFEVGAADVKIEIEAENVSVCAVPEGVDGTATLVVVKTAGPDNVTYDWKPKGNTLTLKDADKANAIVNLSGVVAGAYTFTVKVSDANDNTNYAEKDVKLTVNKLPVFQIDEHCLALHKDSVFTLNVANTGDYSYLWQVSMYDKSQKQWGTPIQKGDNKYCEVQMSNQDMRYILKVEDNSTSLHCAAFDTAYVYRIPDAPLVEIDTNTSRLNIKLEWATVSGNDGYTVWSRKWDPYCMMSADGGVYKATATPHNILTEAATDTLKFYYVTADRNVCGKTYYSLASDTVGYYLFDVRRNTGKMASINYYPVYFDMKGTGANGAYRTKDMFALYGNAITLIKKWNFSTQLWEAAQKLPNGVVANDFDIVVGTLLQLDPKGQTSILQYGVLPNGLSALFARTNTGSKANISHSYMWTHRLDLIDTKDFLTEFTGVSLIKYWDFSSQLWVASQMLPNGVIARKFDLKGLMPLQIELKSGVTSVDWK